MMQTPIAMRDASKQANVNQHNAQTLSAQKFWGQKVTQFFLCLILKQNTEAILK